MELNYEKLRKINLHSHTTFCDGRNTPEEMALSAMEHGLNVFGFSGHSYTSFDESYCMSREGTLKYKEEISRLSRKYHDNLQMLCGVEQDFYSNESTEGYDYVIGSVHAVYNREADKYIYVDYGSERLIKECDEFYHGNFYALAADYYDKVAQVVGKTGCNIIGHFDLITKFNEGMKFFDESHPLYEAAVDKALTALLRTGAIFEINTGAMAKGYRSMPYPSEKILKKIKKGGGKIIISSDAHSTDAVDFAFDDSLRLARLCGF